MQGHLKALSYFSPLDGLFTEISQGAPLCYPALQQALHRQNYFADLNMLGSRLHCTTTSLHSPDSQPPKQPTG